MKTFPIPEAVLEQHIIVLGKTRSGKSSTMRLLVEHLLEEKMPVCIVDPKGDWWGLKLSATGKSAGYPIVIFGGPHADVPINAHAGAQVAELVATGNRPCLIDLKGWMVGDRTRFWIDFASNLFKLTKGTRWLVVDEVHNFAPKGKIMDPESGKALHWANRLASEGLGMGLHMICASQRPQKVHNDLLTSAETLIAMRVLHPSDREAVSEWVKGCGDARLGAEVLGSLAQMGRGEGWVWSPEIGFGPKRIQFPMFKTYDSFKAQDAKSAGALKGWASVDLDEVKAKLAKVIEEAKANDPRELRAKIAELERQVRAGATSKQDPAPDQLAIEDAEKRGFEQAKGKLAAEAEKEFKVRIGATLTALRAAGDAFAAEVKTIVGAIVGPADLKGAIAFSAAPVPAQRSPAPPPLGPRAPKPPAQNGHAGDGTLPGPERRILNALASWKAMGHATPSNAQVAWLAGYSPTSTGYTNPRSSLRTKGLLDYPSPDLVAMTAVGQEIAVASVPDGGLLRHVLGLLPGPEARILTAAADRHPNAASNAEIAQAAGYSPTSTGYTNPRSALRTKLLIDYPSRDQVRAADWLFQ